MQKRKRATTASVITREEDAASAGWMDGTVKERRCQQVGFAFAWWMQRDAIATRARGSELKRPVHTPPLNSLLYPERYHRVRSMFDTENLIRKSRLRFGQPTLDAEGGKRRHCIRSKTGSHSCHRLLTNRKHPNASERLAFSSHGRLADTRSKSREGRSDLLTRQGDARDVCDLIC